MSNSSERPLILSIDPGKTGALASFNPASHELTLVPFSKLSHRDITDALAKLCPLARLVVIEDVHSMPTDGGKMAFSFGFETGVIHGILAANGIKPLPVAPAVWKSAMNLTKDKRRSLEKARVLFPAQAHEFKRVTVDDGKAEAALIAFFVARRLGLVGQ